MAATPSDVRREINTDLSDSEIQTILDRAGRDIDRRYASSDFADTAHRDDFEAVLAAARIAGGRDRRASRKSLDGPDETSASKTYENSEVDHLRGQVRLLDPGEAFSSGGVTADGSRWSRVADDE